MDPTPACSPGRTPPRRACRRCACRPSTSAATRPTSPFRMPRTTSPGSHISRCSVPGERRPVTAGRIANQTAAPSGASPWPGCNGSSRATRVPRRCSWARTAGCAATRSGTSARSGSTEGNGRPAACAGPRVCLRAARHCRRADRAWPGAERHATDRGHHRRDVRRARHQGQGASRRRRLADRASRRVHRARHALHDRDRQGATRLRAERGDAPRPARRDAEAPRGAASRPDARLLPDGPEVRDLRAGAPVADTRRVHRHWANATRPRSSSGSGAWSSHPEMEET